MAVYDNSSRDRAESTAEPTTSRIHNRCKGYKLPPSYYTIKKTFKTIELGYESIHACEYDCCLFRGDDNKDLNFCLVCNTSRWKDSNTPGKKVPKKVLRYFPIIPILQRLYKSSQTAKKMIWHATGKCTEPVMMQHPVDGRAWKKFDTKYLDFAKETRNVRLGLAADGFNLFGNLSQAYSMWLVILTTYNLPLWLCMKESSFILALLILGPKSSGKDIDVYLRPLIEDLKGKHPSYEDVKIKCNVHVELNWTKRSIFYELEYWSFLLLRHNLDIMHIKKILLEAILNNLLMNDKSKDTAKERQDLESSDQVVDILCDLELIYPPALFDIMIHLVIHLPLEALEGGHILPWWMFPFERYMKKLKGYVRNKAKPDGLIAEGYVAEEALTFSSHYFRDVTMKFNRPDRNVDPPPSACQFQVFRSIRQRHVYNDKDPEVSKTNELFALACGPTYTPISINSCVVDGVRYVVHSRDERRTTQNSGICSLGPNGEMYYGQLQKILEFKYLLFRVKWFDTQNQGRKVKRLVLRNNMTQIDTRGEAFKNYQYILVTQVKQVFYLEDKAKPHWKVVEHVNHKKFSDEGVIVVENDPDIIHFDKSSDLLLSTSLNDLGNATLHIDGQLTEVDVPSDIIDVVDEDDEIIDDEDAIPHDLADSDDEDLINVDDDGVDKMSADFARSHGGDGGGEDSPPPHYVPTGCEGYFANRGKGKRKPNLGGRAAGRLNTRDKTQKLSLKEITDTKGPVPIWFEVCGKQTLMPLGEHAAHWSNYIGKIIRGVPLYHPSWLKVPKERKAALIADIRHLLKVYNTNKAAFKAQHWVIDLTTRTYNVEKIKWACPQDITEDEWDKDRAQPFRSTRCSLTPSLWHTLLTGNSFGMRTDEEMRMLEATGTYTNDEINRLARGGKQRGHIPGVGRVLPARATTSPSTPAHESTLNSLHKKVDFMISLFKSDSKYPDMFLQFDSGGASGSGGCGDDEKSVDDQDDEDEDGDGDT
nr:hypothetical protein [Tanacetum cinerariifolium]